MSRLLSQPALDTQAMLEWPALQARLLTLCQTPYGSDCWQHEPFLPDEDAVAAHLREVTWLRQCLERAGEPPDASITQADGRPVLGRALPGATLSGRDLALMGQTLRSGLALVRYCRQAMATWGLSDAQGLCHGFYERVQMAYAAPEPLALLGLLSAAVDDSGQMLDSASPELARLRREARRQRERIHERMQAFFTDSQTAAALQDRVLTERDGRATLPVQAAFKSVIPGVVHGVSASGATLYIEPHAVVDMNNALRVLYEQMDAEIERVARELTTVIAEAREALEAFFQTLGALDRRLAAARLARLLDADEPVLRRQGVPGLSLRQARHPLLWLQAADRTGIVANDVDLGDESPSGTRTLIITGPNTGGKTVFLKLVGLFALMLHAGLHLPAARGSHMALFDPVLVEIGDQQSLAQNLSTFSAHVGHLARFLHGACASSGGLNGALVLVDEIVAGTDPAEGAALACAVLDALHQAGAITVVTTHLGELKLEARQHPGYANASVAFDAERLCPTYRLITGAPGASHAMAIAERLGVPPAVIARARAYLSAPQRDAADLIESLERKNQEVDHALASAQSAREEAQQAFTQADALRRQIRDEKRQALQLFKVSVQQRLHTLEAELKALQRQCRQSEDLSEATLSEAALRLKRTRTAAAALFAQAEDALADAAAQEPLPVLAVGDTVMCAPWGLQGEILTVDPQEGAATLRVGQMTVRAALGDLSPVALPTARPSRRSRPDGAVTPERLQHAPMPEGEYRPVVTQECHVRGLRVEEALSQVMAFLDSAMMANHAAVRIIHGHGSGALKQAIRAYLQASPYAARFYPGAPAEGGDGQTIVELAQHPS